MREAKYICGFFCLSASGLLSLMGVWDIAAVLAMWGFGMILLADNEMPR